MRKVLIVSPRFPPTNAADLHRIRMSLAHYRRYGWEPTVLCIDPLTSDCLDDPLLAHTLPPDVRVMTVRAWDEARCRRFGFGQLGYRSLLTLYKAGFRLLREPHYDVVFFSTTVFLCFVLGRLWKRQFGCKIVYDFQDPWYSEQSLYTRETVPGSWWRYRLDQMVARRLERFAMKAADHIIVVSAGYVFALMRRYRWLARSQFTTLPFGAREDDRTFVRANLIIQKIFTSDREVVRWVYAGRAGPDMAPILTALFRALVTLQTQDADFAARLRLHFVGTNYAPPQRTYKLVEPLAQALGLHGLVQEQPERIAYFEALSLYETGDAILLVGSVHSDYTPSKLFPCILSKKPILALFHSRSMVAEIAGRFPNIFLATFDQSPDEPQFQARVAAGIEWLRAPKFDAATIDAQIKPWTDQALTQVQCAIFDQVSAS